MKLTNPARHLQPVGSEQLLVKMSCGHQVRANDDIFEYVPVGKVPMIHCEQCDRDMVNGLPAVEIRPHYSNLVGVKSIDDALRDVLGGLPFILFGSLVYVSLEQSRLPNGGL